MHSVLQSAALVDPYHILYINCTVYDMYTCTTVQEMLCTHVQLYRRCYVRMYNCTVYDMYTCTTVQEMLCTHVQLYRRCYVHMYNCTGDVMYTCTTVECTLCLLCAYVTSTECSLLLQLLVARSPSSCSRDPSSEEAAPSAHLPVISNH